MDVSASATLLVGFALGLRHATDADHFVAVSTLVNDTANARRAALVGAFWGLGHLLTVFTVGGALVMLRVRVPAQVEWALELLVALVLIWLGVHTIWRCLAGRYHFHVHQHGPHSHAHLHFHAQSAADHEHASRTDASTRKAAGRSASRGAPLFVGMAHGLAGTGGLALLVLTSIPSRMVGVLYLLVFGLGALTGMVAFGALLGVPFARATSRLTWLQATRLASGAASSILGVVLTRRAFLPQSWPF